ncbi:hypothetical protein Tsubulata_007284, partial [Turnera subulata]
LIIRTILATMENLEERNMQDQTQPPRNSTIKLVLVASIAAGVQFGWALQLSLLTPYVQLLGVPHAWAAFIWLCGPLSGMIVQPVVCYHSDRCTSRFGRRSPFIASGATFVIIAIILIGFAADIGHSAGDLLTQTPKSRAVAVFVAGFWVLDVANNTIQGPCRALLADICGSDHKRTRLANALFSFFMGVGNILGYSAGIAWFPFLLYDTDWMAREVYGGNPSGNGEEKDMYDRGVRTGALGLMILSVVLMLMSLSVEGVSRIIGVKKLWGAVNFILAICLAMTVLVTKKAEFSRWYATVSGGETHLLPPPNNVKAGALTIFAGLGIPQAMLVSVVSGPLDEALGGGNLPAFVMGAIAAIVSGLLALTLLPSPPSDVVVTLDSAAAAPH